MYVKEVCQHNYLQLIDADTEPDTFKVYCTKCLEVQTVNIPVIEPAAPPAGLDDEDDPPTNEDNNLGLVETEESEGPKVA